jgi:NTP pyrophosphatase (non-canonical NTP hydrolase)
MNLSDYQKCAERAMTDTDNERRMLNAALGLCGEAAEVANAIEYNDPQKLIEEAGDLLWYVAQMCKAHDETIANVPPRDVDWNEARALGALWYHSGFVADAIKKRVFHQRPMSALVLFDSLQSVVSAVDTLLGFYGHTVAQACSLNNQKLLRRLPNGYTHEDAARRADEVSHAQ